MQHRAAGKQVRGLVPPPARGQPGAWAALVGLAAVLAWPSASAQGRNDKSPTNQIYTCVDQYGRRLTADRPIVECLDREQRVLGVTGTERGRIGPSLTEQERQALEAQRRQEQLERNRIQEERRRDRALLARYPRQSVHDVERTAALSVHDSMIEAAQKQIVQLKAQRKALDVELEFFKNDLLKAPPTLQRKYAENDELILEQQRFILRQEEEKRRVNQRFDEELFQLRRIWAGAGMGDAPASPSAPVAPSPGPSSTLVPVFGAPADPAPERR